MADCSFQRTGDSLFPGGVGNIFGDDAGFKRLLHDVRTQLPGSSTGASGSVAVRP